jgi:phosphopantothenoylcysteine decarboxylase/phosphopantothenate--cysteine ligase
MGIAVAEELIRRGATVCLVLGPTAEKGPDLADIHKVTTSKEMLDTVMSELSAQKTDGFVSAAAVLDFVPTSKEESKLASGSELTVELVPTKKIIEEARKAYKDLFIVGFKVESGVTDDELASKARTKIDAGICDLVVANDEKRKGVAFGTDTNAVLIVGANDYTKSVDLAPKSEIARHIVDEIVATMK